MDQDNLGTNREKVGADFGHHKDDDLEAEKRAEDAAASREGIDEITQEDVDALDIEDGDDADKDA